MSHTKRDPFERYAGEAVTTTGRYNIPIKVIEGIRDLTPEYGSQGRALQVATEILIRRERPIKVKPHGSGMTRITYKLLRRTIRLIDELTAREYGDHSTLFTACLRVLREKC